MSGFIAASSVGAYSVVWGINKRQRQAKSVTPPVRPKKKGDDNQASDRKHSVEGRHLDSVFS